MSEFIIMGWLLDNYHFIVCLIMKWNNFYFLTHQNLDKNSCICFRLAGWFWPVSGLLCLASVVRVWQIKSHDECIFIVLVINDFLSKVLRSIKAHENTVTWWLFKKKIIHKNGLIHIYTPNAPSENSCLLQLLLHFTSFF